AVQTRRQEEADALAGLSEAQRRLQLHGQMTTHNRELAATAQQAGVLTGADFAIFQDHGYRGLYGGLGMRDLHRRKALRPAESIAQLERREQRRLQQEQAGQRGLFEGLPDED